MIKDKFETAVAESKQLSMRPSNDTLLNLYGLYKQATEGDAPSAGPLDAFDFVAKAKYNAWAKLKGTATDSAMQLYVDLVEKLKVN